MKKISFLFFVVIIFSCNDEKNKICYEIKNHTNESFILSLENKAYRDYYFFFKSLHQPANRGPYYNYFKVIGTNEKENLDSLRQQANLNYEWANKKNGFDSANNLQLDSLQQNHLFKGVYFFVPRRTKLEINFSINDGRKTNIPNYPIVLDNLVFKNRRKDVENDFYSKGKIGSFYPYRYNIINKRK